MKTLSITIVITIICASPSCLIAQTIKKKSNEVGLFFEKNYNNNSSDVRNLGIFYRNQTDINKFRRFQLFYTNSNNYSNNNPHSIVGLNDKVISKYLVNNMAGFGVGAGIERQRNFYKNVFLYAALDLRLTYNQHKFFQHTDTSILSNINYNAMRFLNGTVSKIPNFTASGYYVSVLPTVGAKLDIKNKFVIGAEMMITTNVGFYNQKTSTNYTIFDLNMNFFTKRFYVNYKF